MTQYFTNFADDTVGNAPLNWTKRWSTADTTAIIVADAFAASGQALRLYQTTGATDEKKGISWDLVDADANRATCEVYARIKVVGTGRNNRTAAIFGRGNGAQASEDIGTGRITSANPTTTTAQWFLAGASLATDAGTISTDIVQNDIVNLLLTITGTTVSVKAWEDGQSEPGAADATITNASAPTAAGWIGMLCQQNIAVFDFYLGEFGVGTNGDSAPRDVVVTDPTIASTTKLQDGQAFTITGTNYEAVIGTGSVIISPSDQYDAAGAVTQTIVDVADWSPTGITVDSADLTDMSPGDTVYVFVTNDSADRNAAGFAVTIADMVVRVGSATVTDDFMDTDLGTDIVSEGVEVIVHSGAADARDQVYNEASGIAIVNGLLEFAAPTIANIDTEDDTYVVTVISVSNPTTRLGAYVGTVVDRNED